jgi:biopolymer transport protein ExbB/TolQ
LSAALSSGAGQQLELHEDSTSPVIRRFWERVRNHVLAAGKSEDLDIWFAEALRGEQLAAVSRLDRSRMFVRIGPMLGLCGTIIPLGPALRSLLGGDMAGMVSHLVVGVGAVVCGLVMSGVCYYITLIRERWVRAELKDMEDFGDLLMRAIERQRANDEVRHATAQQA